MNECENAIWINPRAVAKVECIEVTNVPNYSWCVMMYTYDGSSYDIHYTSDRDSAIDYANEYIGILK